MRLEVRELLAEEGVTYTFRYSEMVDSQVEDLPFPDPVEGEITLVLLGRTIHVGGRVSTEITLTCGRCLESFPYHLEAVLDEEFFAAPHPAKVIAEPEVRLTKEDFIFDLSEGGVLDITELIRQHLIMAVPISPLCKENCQGLCPRCGINRNQATCQCSLSDVDPRLAVLGQLLEKSG